MKHRTLTIAMVRSEDDKGSRQQLRADEGVVNPANLLVNEAD
tara:strand:- start:303 stop:428 length:126 start_codon:yes stop_codon:yes gene_type:complete